MNRKIHKNQKPAKLIDKSAEFHQNSATESQLHLAEN
jgi:cytoskeletal protein CcmA (bactofilin family)